MGQVWQATDTQLNRQVALKILPDAFAADPERLARFTREAQILASLNHPNIAQIHGIEEAEGTRALVLELVDPLQRVRDIGDVRLAMEGAFATTAGSTVAPPARAVPWRVAAIGAVVLTVLASVATWGLKPGESERVAPVTRFSVAPPPGVEIVRGLAGLATGSALALSPDGDILVYATATGPLYLRALGSLDARPLPGTDGATSPFFSSDGQWVGFFQTGGLRRVSVLGGPAEEMATAGGVPVGASWAPDDTIYFALNNNSGLWQVSAFGGTAKPVTTLDLSRGEVSHRWPQVLPGGETILFTVMTGPGWDERHLELLSLDTGDRTTVVQNGETGRYLASGHLVYERAEELMAVSFDLARGNGAGSPVPLGVQVSTVGLGEGGDYALSDTGTLAYISGGTLRERRLVWRDRQGRAEPSRSRGRLGPTPASAYRPVVWTLP